MPIAQLHQAVACRTGEAPSAGRGLRRCGRLQQLNKVVPLRLLPLLLAAGGGGRQADAVPVRLKSLLDKRGFSQLLPGHEFVHNPHAGWHQVQQLLHDALLLVGPQVPKAQLPQLPWLPLRLLPWLPLACRRTPLLLLLLLLRERRLLLAAACRYARRSGLLRPLRLLQQALQIKFLAAAQLGLPRRHLCGQGTAAASAGRRSYP